MVARVFVALCVVAQVAAAAPAELTGLGTPCVMAHAPPRAAGLPATVSNVLFLNRCVGGCTIFGADSDDARNNRSFIPPPGPHPFTAFKGRDGMPGTADDDDEWTKILACVREVYSYYNVQVTDQLPETGTFHMAIVSGKPEQIGLPARTLGISPFACGGADNAISFSFVEEHASISSDDFVKRVCWTITHEAGHAFTLEHTFHWVDDDRAGCDDVMSYDDQTCHPLRYFRGRASSCGGFMEEPCRCGPVQNPHQKLLSLFGAGTSTVPPGTAAITTPVQNGTTSAVVIAAAGSKRGVSKVELVINGNRWLTQDGEEIGLFGQPNPASYVFALPPHLPEGVVDLVVRAHDDLGAVVESPTITATRGAPCESAETCLDGQTCEAGRCFWAVTGEQGDACTANEFCSTGLCAGAQDSKICTQTCVDADETTCPDGFVCSGEVCLPPESGCCSAGTSQTPWLHGLAMFGFWALVLRRRRSTGEKQ
jgi:hypothetical protein